MIWTLRNLKPQYVIFCLFDCGFGFGQLGGHIALAGWANLRAMPVAPFPLLAEYTYIYIYILSWYDAFFTCNKV